MWKLPPPLPAEACVAQSAPSAKGEIDLRKSLDAPKVASANEELE